MSRRMAQRRHGEGKSGMFRLHTTGAKIIDVVVQAGADLLRDNDTQSAAALAHYSLLSAFPLMLAILAIVSLFISPNWAVDVTSRLLGPVLPANMGTIESIVRDAMGKSHAVSFLAIAGFLWTGSRVFGSLTKALNAAYDVKDDYDFASGVLPSSCQRTTSSSTE